MKNPIEQLREMGREFSQTLSAIHQLTLTDWLTLAARLDVSKNDREHAAKKMVPRGITIQQALA